MKNLMLMLACATVAASAMAQPVDNETARYLAAQVLNYDQCMDTYSVQHAAANASPSEIGMAAAEECKVYHKRFLDVAEAMINEHVPDSTQQSGPLNSEQARMALLLQYYQTATEQKRSAMHRSLNIVVKERSSR